MSKLSKVLYIAGILAVVVAGVAAVAVTFGAAILPSAIAMYGMSSALTLAAAGGAAIASSIVADGVNEGYKRYTKNADAARSEALLEEHNKTLEKAHEYKIQELVLEREIESGYHKHSHLEALEQSRHDTDKQRSINN